MLDQVPSIKDLDIEKRFRDLKNFNEGRNTDDDEDGDNNIGQLPGPLQYLSSSRRDEPSLPPRLPILPVAPVNAMQRFLHPQKVAKAIGQE